MKPATNLREWLGRSLKQRFGLTVALLALGATVLIQAPGLISLGLNLDSARRSREALRNGGADVDLATEHARWDQAVPVAAPAEASRFLTRIQLLVSDSGCVLIDAKEAVPEDLSSAPGLAGVDLKLRVEGSYSEMLRLLDTLRDEPRVLAVVRSSIRPTKYPRLVAEIVVRRYVRRAATFAAVPNRLVAHDIQVDPELLPW